MRAEDNNLVAVLGPTNTGKTYLAFERLMSYQSGIFGFPLRLLAREPVGVEEIQIFQIGKTLVSQMLDRFYLC